jgi:hypothetical protein
MKEKCILPVFIAILLFTCPVAASLTKISSGSPVFIGESNLDISSALLDCHTIAWWPNGTPSAAPPAKNLTIATIGQDNSQVFHYTISPDFFTGSTGPWYCQDKQPPRMVFEVLEPQLQIRAWDLDTNKDVTGTTVPVSSNISYRIDTNLYRALQVRNRPDINPLDSFFRVNLTDPRGRGISNVYSGSAGDANAQIIAFDSIPFISSSPYFWKNAGSWNRESRNANGEKIYPDGTYTFMVTENLNHAQESYAAAGRKDLSGKTFSSAPVTLVRTAITSSVTTTSQTGGPAVTTTTAGTPVTEAVTPELTTTTTSKTTYSPLPPLVALVGIVIAGVALSRKREMT